jgi:hypothetical protein
MLTLDVTTDEFIRWVSIVVGVNGEVNEVNNGWVATSKAGEFIGTFRDGRGVLVMSETSGAKN